MVVSGDCTDCGLFSTTFPGKLRGMEIEDEVEGDPPIGCAFSIVELLPWSATGSEIGKPIDCPTWPQCVISKSSIVSLKESPD